MHNLRAPLKSHEFTGRAAGADLCPCDSRFCRKWVLYTTKVSPLLCTDLDFFVALQARMYWCGVVGSLKCSRLLSPPNPLWVRGRRRLTFQTRLWADKLIVLSYSLPRGYIKLDGKKCLSACWSLQHLSHLLAKAEYWATFLRTSAAVNLTDFVNGDSSSP